MADGKTHRKVTIATIPLIAGGALFSTGSLETAVLCASGGVLGIFVEPDLDVDHKTVSESTLMRILPLGWVWYIYWKPYALLMPHRIMFSHWPILSTLIRWIYLFGPTALILFLLGYPVGVWFQLYLNYLVAVFVGNAITDYMHFGIDVF